MEWGPGDISSMREHSIVLGYFGLLSVLVLMWNGERVKFHRDLQIRGHLCPSPFTSLDDGPLSLPLWQLLWEEKTTKCNNCCPYFVLFIYHIYPRQFSKTFWLLLHSINNLDDPSLVVQVRKQKISNRA